jgi:hypothetical protein
MRRQRMLFEAPVVMVLIPGAPACRTNDEIMP